MEPRPAVTVSQVSSDALPGESMTDERNGCPWHDVLALLRQVKLRPTRQRMALGWLLFAKGDRHLTAEMLYEGGKRAKIAMSLATVYNTFTSSPMGLLREVAVNGSKTYFDTNVSDHPPLLHRGEHNLVDIPHADRSSASCLRFRGYRSPRRRGRAPQAEEALSRLTSELTVAQSAERRFAAADVST